MPRALASILAGIMLVLVCPPAARAADRAGVVIAIAGDCFVEAEGKRAPLKMGGEIHVADTIDVPGNAKLKLRMEDGSILSVAAGSQMKVATYSVDADGKRHEASLSLVQGLVRAVVAPIDRPASFEVNTAVGSAGVRSTDWFVESQPGQMVVGVVAGTVVLKSAGTGAEVTIPAGSGANAAVGQDPSTPRVWKKAEFNALIVRTDFPAAAPKPSPRPSPPRSSEPTAPEVPTPAPPAPYSPPGGYNAPSGGGYYQPPYGGNPPPSGGYAPYPGGGYQSPSGAGGRY